MYSPDAPTALQLHFMSKPRFTSGMVGELLRSGLGPYNLYPFMHLFCTDALPKPIDLGAGCRTTVLVLSSYLPASVMLSLAPACMRAPALQLAHGELAHLHCLLSCWQ